MLFVLWTMEEAELGTPLSSATALMETRDVIPNNGLRMIISINTNNSNTAFGPVFPTVAGGEEPPWSG